MPCRTSSEFPYDCNMAVTLDLPRWNLDSYFPSLESTEYQSAKTEVGQLLDNLETAFKQLGIGLEVPAAGSAQDFEKAVSLLNELSLKFRVVRAFPSLKVAANSSDEEAQSALSDLKKFETRLEKLGVAFAAWVGKQDVETIAGQSKVVADHKFPLLKLKKSSEKLMSKAEEELAADLEETGASAWSKFYFDYSANISVELDGKELPMSAVRAMAYDESQEKRQTAYFAELDAWKKNEIAAAASMNSIKGAANLLAKRRGWESQLAQTLFACNMDRGSLDAMMSAAKASFPQFRRYLKAKSKVLGNAGALPFYDLFAPIGGGKEWTYPEACAFVVEGFGSYSEKMANFAQMTFDQNWHDVPPMKGKRDGAFCAGGRPGESRILLNYKPAFGSVATLAHELGHAYHNLCLKDRAPLQKETPMTLAETASIFCETIIKRKAIAESEGQEKLAILEASIQGACQVVVDISSRYAFETKAIEGRWNRELSAREFCEAMAESQRETYGDGLDQDLLHPYMWAAKPHYYGYMAFYNFPYMFGLLFALGLYRVYQESPDGFHDRYDDLLSSTGLFPAAELTNRFGIDISSQEFWAGSLAVIVDDIDQFCSLVEA